MAGLRVRGQLDQAFPPDPEILEFQGHQATPNLPLLGLDLIRASLAFTGAFLASDGRLGHCALMATLRMLLQ